MELGRILLTGCNRGLGKDCVRFINSKYPEFAIVGTARSNVDKVKEEFDKELPDNKVEVVEFELNSADGT